MAVWVVSRQDRVARTPQTGVMTESTNQAAPRAGGPGVWPALLFDDPDAVRRFLTEDLGFEERLTVRGEDGRSIVHGELRWPEGGGVMYGSARGRTPGGGPPAVGGQVVYVVTADPDTVYERARRAGATIVDELSDKDYGSRDFAVADPEGNVWSFGTYAGA